MKTKDMGEIASHMYQCGGPQLENCLGSVPLVVHFDMTDETGVFLSGSHPLLGSRFHFMVYLWTVIRVRSMPKSSIRDTVFYIENKARCG